MQRSERQIKSTEGRKINLVTQIAAAGCKQGHNDKIACKGGDIRLEESSEKTKAVISSFCTSQQMLLRSNRRKDEAR